MTRHHTQPVPIEPRHPVRRFLGAIAAAALLLAAVDVAAQQRTLDPELQREIFSNIDARLQSLEQARAATQPTLERLGSDIAELKAHIDELPARDAQRVKLSAEVTHLIAQFVKEGRQLIDAVIETVGGNLGDLDRLATALRGAAASASPETLQHTIDRNVSTGRAMKQALVQLAQWSADDPALKRRFDGLQRILRTLDTRVTTDRRIANATANPSAQGRHARYADHLDNAIGELSDTYMQLQAERQRLDDLRDEVLVATQIGELEITRIVTERALPGLGSDSTVPVELPGLSAVMDVVVGLNSEALDYSRAAGDSESHAPSQPPVGEFRNF